MKHLPCEHCHAGAWVKIGVHEEPLVVGRVGRFPYRYKCSRCKRLTTLGVREYNRLPHLGEDELVALGLPRQT